MKRFNHYWAWSCAVFLSVSTSSMVHAQCKGEERWPVKTGTDAGVPKVNLAPVTVSIDTMNTWNGGAPYSWAQLKKLSKTRIAPYEFQVYHVEGMLTWYQEDANSKTGDLDYHLVLQSDSGESIIAKVPNPRCVDPSSPFLEQIKQVRAAVAARLSPGKNKKKAMIRVAVEGPAFFDKAHSQLGRAENSVEIHPVLKIEFLK